MSKHRSERKKLSSLAEMHCLVHEAADFTATSPSWKERVHAAARAFGFEWERTKAFYYRTARRVDAQEMDVARREIQKLRAEAEQREAAGHLAWVGRTLAYLEASDPELYREEIAALERAVDATRRAGRPVAVSEGKVK